MLRQEEGGDKPNVFSGERKVILLGVTQNPAQGLPPRRDTLHRHSLTIGILRSWDLFLPSAGIQSGESPSKRCGLHPSIPITPWPPFDIARELNYGVYGS